MGKNMTEAVDEGYISHVKYASTVLYVPYILLKLADANLIHVMSVRCIVMQRCCDMVGH